MKIQAPPGMRDFYPADMRVQNWLFDIWRRVSRSFGFSEYEGPIFESLELYRLKSGEGIVGELFSFSDRGEREFAIRPEMTPTLARMVAARANALPRPIKWFSIPRMCRAERPQRGRLREFFQWNADILGVDEIIADAEVIAVGAESLRAVGLREGEAAVQINDRRLATAVLAGLGIDPDRAAAAFQLLDRVAKLPREEFERQWSEAYRGDPPSQAILSIVENKDIHECLELARRGFERLPGLAWNAPAAAQFRELFDRLADFGVAAFVEFDPGVVRGIAYYTGVVFETYVRAGGLRALQGGGRYDDLTSLLDGPKLSGVGLGMGDAPILAALEDLGRLPTQLERLDAYMIVADRELFGPMLGLTGKLRAAGLSVDFTYKEQHVGKQFKSASSRAAKVAIVLNNANWQSGTVEVKDLTTGVQRAVTRAALEADPLGVLGIPNIAT